MADEMKKHNQAIVDAQSALDAKQQEIADSLAVKNAQLAEKDAQIATQATQIATKDARIAELEAAAGNSIDPAEVTAATTALEALTADIASTPT